MKKHILLFSTLALMVIAIISACKKDPDPNNNEPSSDTIYFGDTTGMIVTTHNAIMEFDDNNKPLMIDLDGNGTHDIKIETCYDGPMSIGEYQTLTLHCLHNHTELLGDSIVKVSYSHRESVISQYGDLTLLRQIYRFSTCEMTSANDQVNHTKVFELYANDFDDSFDEEDPFLSTQVKLFDEDLHYVVENSYSPNGDTLMIDDYSFNYRCWNFPTDEEKYIGFKLTSNGKSRLGWLKIKLHPNWGNSVVDTELIETAIQK